ncbi:DUF3450 family protein, partial [Sinimarinibacterium thermocellulolyticum]
MKGRRARSLTSAIVLSSAPLALCLVTGPVLAATVPEVVEAADRWRVAQAQSQRRVDDLGEERRGLAEEYRTVLREIEGLEAYNRQLE